MVFHFRAIYLDHFSTIIAQSNSTNYFDCCKLNHFNFKLDETIANAASCDDAPYDVVCLAYANLLLHEALVPTQP